MKEFKNNLTRPLDFEEHKAIMEAFKLLCAAFHKKPFSLSINPNTQNPSDVWGVAFSFDLEPEGYK